LDLLIPPETAQALSFIQHLSARDVEFFLAIKPPFDGCIHRGVYRAYFRKTFR